jgi:hypothetical protein
MNLNSHETGRWAFLIGLALAVITPFIIIPYTGLALFILGLIIGFVNVKGSERHSFLLAVIALMVIGVGGIQLLALTSPVMAILTNIIALVSPAGLVVAVKEVLAIGKNG